jgi:hypothetical protein
MTNCEKCGFSLPDSAEYCPNCGSPVKRIPQVSAQTVAPVSKLLQAGLLGALLSVMVTSITPPDLQLYFLPSFVGALVSIYLFRARRLDEAIVISFGVYLFAEGILGGLIFGSLYAEGISLSDAYGGYMLTLVDVAMYIIDPATAIAAAYIGNRLISKPTVRQTSPYTYQEKEDRGGIVFSTDAEEASAFPSHNV